MQKKLSWRKGALEQFTKALDYIEEISPQNAEKVEQDILNKLNRILKYPESCPPDKYRVKNSGNNYRAFELHRFRISYHVGLNEIRIIRVRNTKMKPLRY